MLNMFTAMYMMLLGKWEAFKQEEKGAVDIVAIVVMIGIAVALAVIFRTQIQNLLETLFESIFQNAEDAVS